MAESEIYLIAGAAGWVQARFATSADAKSRRRLFVRFEPDRKGRWIPVEWSIPHMPTDLLRRIPFHRILQALEANEPVRAQLADRFEEEAEPGFRQAFGEPVRHTPISFERPKTRRLDDSFYKDVALVYRQAIGRGFKPRQAIAEAAGVSSDVAGRWIYQARKRGFIPKTKPGKVSA